MPHMRALDVSEGASWYKRRDGLLSFIEHELGVTAGRRRPTHQHMSIQRLIKITTSTQHKHLWKDLWLLANLGTHGARPFLPSAARKAGKAQKIHPFGQWVRVLHNSLPSPTSEPHTLYNKLGTSRPGGSNYPVTVVFYSLLLTVMAAKRWLSTSLRCISMD